MGTINEKLTYLSETKNEIKEMVNNLGGNITNQTTFRNYKNEIQNMLNNYFDYLPRLIGKSANLTLTPTINNKMELNIIGQWYQNGTPTPNNEINIQYSTGTNTLTISDATEENTQVGTINLGNNKVYNGDYFSKEDGTWYLYNTKGEITYTGDSSENWGWLTSKRTYYIAINDMLAQSIDLNDEGDFIRTNYYEYRGKPLWQDTTFTMTYGFLINNENLNVRNLDIAANSVASFKTWLSTHNLKVIYTLATPNKIEITDTDTISTLESLANVYSYLGTTKIKIESNDGLPLLADVSAVKKM